jgi:DNA primase
MDVIACNKYGFKGAVAPMGTALTEEQILSLFSMVADDEKLPVLCFDGDNAGRNAASRACERILPLLKPGRSVRFAFLPEGEDPDSLLRAAGAEGFKKFLSSSLSLFDFIWAAHTAGRSFDTPESRAGLDKALQKQIGAIADPEIQKHYRELVRTRISDSFFKPYRPSGRSQNKGPQAPTALRIRPLMRKKNRIAQRILLCTIINNPELYAHIEEEFGRFEIEEENLNALRAQVVDSLNEDPGLDTESLCARLKSQGLEKERDDILNESVYVHAAFARKGSFESLGEGPMRERWLSYYEGLLGHGMDEEVKARWKSAFESSNEQQEDRLRDMVRIKSTE